MSQVPEMPATGWPEQGYEPQPQAGQAPPGPGHAPQYPQPSAAQWEQDTQADWVQQPYPNQQGYQGYAEQRQWAAQADPTMAVQQQPPAEADASGAGLPTEFDHLFRDSTPDSRRAIDRQKPMVGGAGLGYLGAPQPEAVPQQPLPEAAAHEQAAVPQAGAYQPYPPPFPQSNEQFQGAPQYAAEQYPAGPYPADYQQQPGFGHGGGFDDGQGGGPGWTEGRGVRNRKVLIAGGAVAVVAVIGIVLATSNNSPGTPHAAGVTTTPSASKADPKQQADAVYRLIQQSGQLRSDANTGVVDVNGCKNLADAQSLLASTAQKRQAQADNVAKLDVTGIRNGTQLVSQLKAAWTASAQYDDAYAQIAGDLQGGCKTTAVKKDANYRTANEAAGAADDAKAQAAQLWNDNVATPLGESQVTGGKL